MSQDPYSYQDQDVLLDRLLDDDASLFRRLGQVRLMWSLIALSVAVGAMIYLVWFNYPTGGSHDPEATPILYAEKGAFKERPDDAGGMNIAHQDSSVFNSLRHDDGDQVENLFAPRSEGGDVDREQLFSGLKTELKSEPVEAVSQAVVIEQEVEPLPLEPQWLPQKEATKVAPVAAPVEDQRKVAVKAFARKVIEKQEAAPVVAEVRIKRVPSPRPARAVVAAKPRSTASDIIARAATAGQTQVKREVIGASAPVVQKKSAPVRAAGVWAGDYYVQLGSMRSDTAARAQWQKLTQQFPDLGYLKLRVQKIDIKGRGTYYRVQGGAVAKDSAKQLCDMVKAKKPNGCIIVKK